MTWFCHHELLCFAWVRDRGALRAVVAPLFHGNNNGKLAWPAKVARQRHKSDATYIDRWFLYQPTRVYTAFPTAHTLARARNTRFISSMLLSLSSATYLTRTGGGRDAGITSGSPLVVALPLLLGTLTYTCAGCTRHITPASSRTRLRYERLSA